MQGYLTRSCIHKHAITTDLTLGRQLAYSSSICLRPVRSDAHMHGLAGDRSMVAPANQSSHAPVPARRSYAMDGAAVGARVHVPAWPEMDRRIACVHVRARPIRTMLKLTSMAAGGRCHIEIFDREVVQACVGACSIMEGASLLSVRSVTHTATLSHVRPASGAPAEAAACASAIHAGGPTCTVGSERAAGPQDGVQGMVRRQT